MAQSEFARLTTERGEALWARLAADPAARPWPQYPRPRLVREGWINLNGSWDFGAGTGPEPVYDRKILVPFPPESDLSGAEGFDGKRTPRMYYRRTFSLAEIPAGKRLLLHCGGADQTVERVRFNGTPRAVNHTPLLDGPFLTELTEMLLKRKN